jgi:acyl-CoA thioesterase-1
MRDNWFASKRWLRVLACLYLCMGLSHAALSAPATLLVMGDSLSAGYGIRVENGWVALLVKRLAEQGYEYHVVNASVSGETSGGGKVRLPGLLNTHKPAIVILELGANDGLRGLPNTLTRNNLATMIDMAQQAKARVLLVGMQIPTNYGPTYANGFKALFADLASSTKIALVPFLLDGVALDTSRMQADNLHPNELGQPRLLDNVWPTLHKLLVH